MNQLVREFSELEALSKSFCYGNSPLVSFDDFIKRLKDFNDKYINNYGDDSLVHLKLKLLCHLSVMIRDIRKTDDKLSVVKSMKNLIRTSTVDEIEVFVLMYNSLSYEIYKEDDIKLCEEIKLAVLEFLTELIKRCTNRVLGLLYSEDYKAKFCMGVFIAVKIAREEKSFKLRATALDFLLCAMQYHKRNDKVLQAKVGDIFMFYLPGVIGRLEDIVLWNETQQHSITVKAIAGWGQLLCTVMRDLSEEDDLSDEDQIKMWLDLNKNVGIKNIDVKKALEEKVRNKRWLEAAAQTIQPLISKIPEVRKHSHPKVRLELITQVSRLLDECLMTLKNSINPMIEIVMSSMEDEEEEVQAVAETALAIFERRCRDKNGQIYLDIIEEHLNSVVNKLPNALHLQDDGAILRMMESFCGDLKILKNSCKLGRVIHFSSNLTRLARVLLMSVRLSLHSEISLQDYSVWDDDFGSTWTRDWKIFNHFADSRITGRLNEICRLIGSDDCIETILDFLFDLLKEDDPSRNEIILLVNQIVEGSSNIRDNVVEQLLSVYLNPDYLYLPLHVDEDECTNIPQSRANIITVAVLMEGLGKLSTVLGKRFENYLLRSLYFVIEKMGSSYSVIRKSAVTAATQISESVGLAGDIRLLIQENIDYLTYHITVKLRREYAGVFDVVTVLMKNSPFEAISNLEEIINNVLRTSTEKFDSPLTMSYLRLFQTFVRCVNKWMNDVNTKEEEIPEGDKTDVDLLLDYIRERESAKREEDSDEEPVVEKEEEHQGDESDSKNLPKHIRLTVSVAENALNYLPSNNFDKKLLVLEILNECILILANWENELLPIVHKIWSPLVTRFQQFHDPLLISRSFTLLYNMSRTSKDFIRRRTLKRALTDLGNCPVYPQVFRACNVKKSTSDLRRFPVIYTCGVFFTNYNIHRKRMLKEKNPEQLHQTLFKNVLPTLREFLLKSAGKSKLKDSGTGYHFTQEFKLQKELLNNLGTLAADLGLPVKELDMILESCFPYLSAFQPLPLQESCRKLFTDLKNYDPFVVWYRLHVSGRDCEYSKNVCAIMDVVKSGRP